VLKKDLELRRRITLVLPTVGVFNNTVYKNVSYGLTIRGIRGGDSNKKVIRMLEFVGLSKKEIRMPLHFRAVKGNVLALQGRL